MFTLAGHWQHGFSLLVKLLMTQGRVNVLSSPRIATINNQTAVIKVGDDQFFITGVNSTTDSSAGSQSQSQNIDFTPFFSGVALNVTPHIDDDDTLTLHIHPLISTVTEKEKNFTVSGQSASLPLAASSIRESDSIVHAKDNQMIIIGGLMASDSHYQRSSTPWLAKLPLLGPLFTSQHNQASKKEIIILLQPTIIHHNFWQPLLKNRIQQLQTFHQPFTFHPILSIYHHQPQATPSTKDLSTALPSTIKTGKLFSSKKTAPNASLQQAAKLLAQVNANKALQLLKQQAPFALPHHHDYFAMMAALELQQQHYATAAALYQQLQLIDPSNPIDQAGLAIAQLQIGQTQLATLPLARALTSPYLPPALYRYISQCKQLTR